MGDVVRASKDRGHDGGIRNWAAVVTKNGSGKDRANDDVDEFQSTNFVCKWYCNGGENCHGSPGGSGGERDKHANGEYQEGQQAGGHPAFGGIHHVVGGSEFAADGTDRLG